MTYYFSISAAILLYILWSLVFRKKHAHVGVYIVFLIAFCAGIKHSIIDWGGSSVTKGVVVSVFKGHGKRPTTSKAVYHVNGKSYKGSYNILEKIGDTVLIEYSIYYPSFSRIHNGKPWQ